MAASTLAAPVNDCAPSCLVSDPNCSEMTAPNGIATSAVGRIGDAGDEPGLLDELPELERAANAPRTDGDGEREQVPGLASAHGDGRWSSGRSPLRGSGRVARPYRPAAGSPS